MYTVLGCCGLLSCIEFRKIPRAHVCRMQKGEFIIDQRDMDNYRSFPIWKIDSQRLLQKYEAYEQDGRLLHRAVCTV